MSDYLVSYDLDRPGQDYDRIVQRLAGLGGRRVLFSEWIVRGNNSAVTVKDDLVRYIDANDRLLVIDITGDPSAGYNLMQ